MEKGRVFIVGAGPGDPDLITVKGNRILRKAQVLVYDNLVSDSLIKVAKNAEKIYVGKRKGKQALSQGEINKLLVKLSQEGKTVVRLKGGDPFIFGRGGEESEYLEKRFIPFEVVPGITSALAAASAAKIPLTKRGISSSVAFCTGHPKNKIAAPNADTLVYYMSASSIKDVLNKVISAGWDKQTPLAIISSASMPQEKIYFGTLESIFKENKSYLSPVILIIGNVAAKGKVLVTGLNCERYKKLGEVIHQPLIRIAPLNNYRLVDNKIKRVDKYDWIIFTSPNAVNYFMQRLHHSGKDRRMLLRCKIASVGRETSRELKRHDLNADLESQEESAKGLITVIKERAISDAHVLLPRSNLASGYLPRELRKLGNRVTDIHIYKNEMPESIKKIDLSTIGAIVFTSGSTVRNFKKIYKDLPDNIKCYARGCETRNIILKEFRNKRDVLLFS